MTRASATPAREAVASRAWLLRKTALGEADWALALFTERWGLVSAIAAHARRSQKRFGGSLEPFHTLTVRLQPRPHSELWRALDAQIALPRVRLLDQLYRLDAAGKFLQWVRASAPRETEEPLLWQLGESLLDAVDAAPSQAEARRCAASAGLRLLGALGWQLELSRCVITGAACPPGKAARVDPARGGLIAQSAGRAPIALTGPQRERLIAVQRGGDALLAEDAAVTLALVEAALAAHVGPQY